MNNNYCFNKTYGKDSRKLYAKLATWLGHICKGLQRKTYNNRTIIRYKSDLSLKIQRYS